MSYYMTKKVNGTFDEVVKKITELLKEEGFGILTEIDVSSTLKKKLDVEFRPYLILGACNPPFAHKALQAEDKIGTLLPCNVIVQQTEDGMIEVAAIDPLASMAMVHNPQIDQIARQIKEKLNSAIQKLS